MSPIVNTWNKYADGNVPPRPACLAHRVNLNWHLHVVALDIFGMHKWWPFRWKGRLAIATEENQKAFLCMGAMLILPVFRTCVIVRHISESRSLYSSFSFFWPSCLSKWKHLQASYQYNYIHLYKHRHVTGLDKYLDILRNIFIHMP